MSEEKSTRVSLEHCEIRIQILARPIRALERTTYSPTFQIIYDNKNQTNISHNPLV